MTARVRRARRASSGCSSGPPAREARVGAQRGGLEDRVNGRQLESALALRPEGGQDRQTVGRTEHHRGTDHLLVSAGAAADDQAGLALQRSLHGVEHEGKEGLGERPVAGEGSERRSS